MMKISQILGSTRRARMFRRKTCSSLSDGYYFSRKNFYLNTKRTEGTISSSTRHAKVSSLNFTSNTKHFPMKFLDKWTFLLSKIFWNHFYTLFLHDYILHMKPYWVWASQELFTIYIKFSPCHWMFKTSQFIDF